MCCSLLGVVAAWLAWPWGQPTCACSVAAIRRGEHGTARARVNRNSTSRRCVLALDVSSCMQRILRFVLGDVLLLRCCWALSLRGWREGSY